MSTRNDNERLAEGNPTKHHLRLYYVRIHHARDELKLEAKFGKHFSFPFNQGEKLSNTESNGPVLYTLDLELKQDNSGQLLVYHIDDFKPCGEYRLNGSHVKISTITHEEKKIESRSLYNHFKDKHLFLFDVRFDSARFSQFPGENTSPFTNLCLFTYFLLRKPEYDIFNILVHQFQSLLIKENYSLNKSNFQDFFDKSYKYLQYISIDLPKDLVTLKILLRMIGLLVPIEKETLDLNYPSLHALTIKMMHYIRGNFDDLLKLVNKSEWLLLQSGLTILSSFELLHHRLDPSRNELAFLNKITDGKQREAIANEILGQLLEIDKPFSVNTNWTDLFTLMNSDEIDIKYLNLAGSFENFIMCIIKISKKLINYSDFEEKIPICIDNCIFYDRLKVDMKNILYLLKFLEEELTYDDVNTKHLISTVQSAIRTSKNLKLKVKDYFDKLDLTMEIINQVQLVFNSIHKFEFLSSVNKYEYLEKSLNETMHTHKYYITWFQCFLGDRQEIDDIYQAQYKVLFECWLNNSTSKTADLMSILMAIDELLVTFDKSNNIWFYSYFIDRMINLCFQEESIISVIDKGLCYVQNELFRVKFRNKFDQNYLSHIPKGLFKEISNDENPLCKLIKLNKLENNKTPLIYELIEFICDKIDITEKDLMDDTFYQPSKTTFTYRILFEDSFAILPIHGKIIKKLGSMWDEWEKNGFHVAEIKIWNKLKEKQLKVAEKIWNLIEEYHRKTKHLRQLIDEANEKLKEVTKIKNTLTLCLDNYCQNAPDKSIYDQTLDDLQRQLDRDKIRSIKVPSNIKVLIPFADRLNPIYGSSVWRKFLQEHKSAANKEIEDNLNVDIQKMNCLAILKQNKRILDLFIIYLNNMWINKMQPFHSQLEQLFPEKNLIDHEFDIFKPLLDQNVVSYVSTLVDYWKNRESIIHICRGSINLLTKYNIFNPDQLFILQDILNINEQTSSKTCIMAYQNYCKYYSKYSEFILKFIGQWSSLQKLIEFLYSLTAADVDDLLEVVNDSDETSINTKTVLDFVTLKSIFDQVDTMVKTNYVLKPLDFDSIIHCFEKLLEKKEFKDILKIFDLCSASLFDIQRIYTESTDKEQSKRKRILDIMQKSSFGFCFPVLKTVFTNIEYEFDICITIDNCKPIEFSVLCELRDRAHLIHHTNNNNNRIQNYTENDIQQLQLFISFVETIQVILESLTALNRAGYPSITEFLLPNTEFICYQGNYNELEQFKSNLETQLSDWNNKLCIMYEKCIDLTYFSHQQLWIVEKSLYQRTAIARNDPAYHLLQFIGINPQSISFELLPSYNENIYDRIKNMAQILNAQRSQRKFSSQNVQINKRIFVIHTSYKRILRAIFSLSNSNDKSIKANQLFYCTKNTNWIEIRAFIYRCFYSQTLHQLIQPELLSLLIQDQFVQLLNPLIEHYPNHFFQLGIITTESSSQLFLINGLKMYGIVQIMNDQNILSMSDLEKVIQSLVKTNATLVTSKIAGLGKSTYIQNEILKLGKKYVKFPINGDVNIDTLMERLRDENIQSSLSPIAIHIDISAVENVQQLNEFLYSLILFRCFRFGPIPVDIPNDIPIYIELDSSLYLSNLRNEIVILHYLTPKHIDSMDWNELKFNSSAVQLVTHYLQAIDDGTINTKHIDEGSIKSLDQLTCIDLLRKHFLSKRDLKYVSWTQLSIFISVYYKLFSGFSKCGFFMVQPELNSSLRLDILSNLLKSSDQFTSVSVETIRQNQRSIDDNTLASSFGEAIIRWDKSQPFTLIFGTNDVPLFIYRTLNDVPSSLIDTFRFYFQTIERCRTDKGLLQRLSSLLVFGRSLTNDITQTKSTVRTAEDHLNEFLIDHNKMTHEQFFLRLTLLSTKYLTTKSICEKCFNQYQYTEKQCKTCAIENSLIRLSSSNSDNIEIFQKIFAEKLHSQYVLTADNYIKMLLVYLRVRSNLPVLIMGETGCGKTALIQCLCQKILDDEMEVFHIHAGITNEKIIETMYNFIKQAQKCFETDQNKRLWIFFDEFNTTPNIGLLKEIICDRTLLGVPLPTNMVFLGACNPQRRKEKKEQSAEQTSIKTYHSEIQRLTNNVDPSLLYSVVPIPETMLEHIWDYGYLDKTTEKNYIKTILNSCTQLTSDDNWFNCIVNLISESQSFFREREDVSSVSLRDVVRFCRFYKWFYNFPIPCESEKGSMLHYINHCERASLLALFLCYYYRLNSSKERKDYMIMIEDSIKKIKSEVSYESLDALLQNEKMALVKKMELPLDTAENRALTDNIFVLFTCILNQIPVILSGKPGSSKTSSVQIVISNLRGKNSVNPFFQTLPKLIATSYQGSHNCTSESIVKVFAKADKCRKENNADEVLPVIVFDEIGLAELSPHNPLKVLHSELEIETCRHGFVGLSNWRLDASKMNRAIYLCSPDPDLDDLKLTAVSLSKSMLTDNAQTVPIDDCIIESLAMAYMSMHDHMKQFQNQQYFGLRDYYSLIKGIVYDKIQQNNKEQDLYTIIQYHLSYNFDGILHGSKFMWSKFCEYMRQKYKIVEYSPPTFDHLLHHKILLRNGRFLMLIGETEDTFDYAQRYVAIQHPTIPTRTLIGSTLSGDFLSNGTYTEKYNNRILMDIILYAEKDTTIFLRGLGHLYDNLYDLFNQSFAVSGKRKYCRITLGSLYHTRCVIHDNFYCIVFVKKQDLDKYDPPFLNRFEKHFIDMDSLIDESHKTVIRTLVQWTDQLLSTEPNEILTCRKYLFMWSHQNYLLNLVTEAFDQLQQSEDHTNNYENLLKYCQDQILRVSSFDLPLLLSLRLNNDRSYIIQQYYKIHTDLSLSSFINRAFEHERNPRLLIYTYTQIYHSIDYSSITNHQQQIEEINLNHVKDELELIQKLKTYYQTDSSFLLCIRVDYHENHEHIPMLKHLLLNELVTDNKHGICLIFHLQRHKLNQTTNAVFFNGWSRVMIDDLQTHQLIPASILMNPSYDDMITHHKFLNLETIFDELINGCIMKFRYTVANKNSEARINNRLDQILQQITLHSTNNNDDNQRSLRSIIKNHLSEIIKDACDVNKSECEDWRKDLLTNGIIISSCYSFNNALLKTISIFLDKYLTLLLAQYEKHSMIDSYLFLINCDGQIHDKLGEIWHECLNTRVKKIDMTIMNQNYIEILLVFDLHLPCAIIEYENIRQIREIIAQNRQNDEENWMDYAYKQLINTSIYGSFINQILDDPDLFNHYYYDQLTLARNEANIHQLSTSFIQRLLTSKLSRVSQDQLRYLLTDYEELIEIMRICEIVVSFIGDENAVYQTLNQQYIVFHDEKENNIEINNRFFRLILRDSDFYLMSPGSSEIEENRFECRGNPFIEISLMNLLELIVSPTNIDRIKNMKELLTIYGLVTQNMITLTRYGHYEIANLEKINSFLCLAFCISIIFPDNKALYMFRQIYSYNGFCITFQTLDQIHTFVSYLKKVIQEQNLPISKTIIQQTLLKLENDLLRNWSIGHTDQYNNIIKFVHDHDLWKYSGKILTLVDKSLQLSSIVEENFGQIFQNDENDENNLDLCLPDDQTQKLEILMSMRIYMQLILDKNYQSRVITNNKSQLLEILIEQLDYFKENLDELKHIQTNDKLKLISLISWIKYYIQYYVYALKDNIRHDIMNKIDEIFVEDTSSVCSTLKLYIIKQLCYSKNTTFYDIYKGYADSNVVWIRSMTVRTSERLINVQRAIILPTPLFECSDEFIRINEKLKPHLTSDEMKELINECCAKRDTTYCFFIWFIQYYTRFYVNNTSPDEPFVKLIRDDVKQQLITCFERIGYQLIYSLLINFDEKSYFHLNTFMSTEDVHQRLLVLNIIVLLISYRFAKDSSALSSLLFNENVEEPQNYTEHFDKLSYLTGVALAKDPVLIQMMKIRTQINDEPESNMHIVRCSIDCFWLFCIKNSTISDDQKQCPLCNREIEYSPNEKELKTDDAHIRMTKNEALEFISQYIKQHKQKDRLNTLEKPDHLDRLLTYHFMDFFMHAIFLFLYELNFMSCSTLTIRAYFQEQIQIKYISIRKHLSDVDQCYIWLYKLINHLMNENFIIKDYLNTPEEAIQLEKLIEEKLIIPHIDSIIGEIREYKSVYVDFIYRNDMQNQLVSFVEELVEDNEKYPLLRFFNVTNIHSIDIVDAFHNKLQLQPDYEKSYPLTTFLLKHLSDYENIQYLYPIIRFTNYLMQQFDHRIKRNDATKKTISDCLKNDPSMKIIYEQFLDAWYKINLKEVYFNERKYQFKHLQQKYNFENKTNISMFLLHKSNDDENMIVVACLQTFAILQNDFIDYFYSYVVRNEDKDEQLFHRTIPIQSMQQKHIFNFDRNKLRKLIVEKGSIFNYTYGMSKEIIYDFDEIEWILRNEISCLPWIDIKNIKYFNYQFELYDENISLVNDIRQRFEQKLLDDGQRRDIKQIINASDNDSILELSGSLEYILTYLRTVNNKNILETATIQSFIDGCLNPKVFIGKKILTERSFSTIHLKYLVDLYELIEECIFDKILSNNIRNDLCEQSFPLSQRTSIINQFIDMISKNESIADCFKDFNCWIDMLKRLLVRLLLPKMNINLDLPLHDYVKRSDIWKGNVTKENIRTIEVKNDIRLKHAFIILRGLEEKENERKSIEKLVVSVNNDYEHMSNRNKAQTASSAVRSTNLPPKRKGPIKRSDLR